MPEIKAGYQATPEQVANILKQGYIEGGIVGANTRLYGQVYGGGLYARQLVAPVRGSTGQKEYVYVSETAYQQARNLVPSYNPRTGTEPLRVIKTPERQYGTQKERPPSTAGTLSIRDVKPTGEIRYSVLEGSTLATYKTSKEQEREAILAKTTTSGYRTVEGKTQTLVPEESIYPVFGFSEGFARKTSTSGISVSKPTTPFITQEGRTTVPSAILTQKPELRGSVKTVYVPPKPEEETPYYNIVATEKFYGKYEKARKQYATGIKEYRPPTQVSVFQAQPIGEQRQIKPGLPTTQAPTLIPTLETQQATTTQYTLAGFSLSPAFAAKTEKAFKQEELRQQVSQAFAFAGIAEELGFGDKDERGTSRAPDGLGDKFSNLLLRSKVVREKIVPGLARTVRKIEELERPYAEEISISERFGSAFTGGIVSVPKGYYEIGKFGVEVQKESLKSLASFDVQEIKKTSAKLYAKEKEVFQKPEVKAAVITTAVTGLSLIPVAGQAGASLVTGYFTYQTGKEFIKKPSPESAAYLTLAGAPFVFTTIPLIRRAAIRSVGEYVAPETVFEPKVLAGKQTFPTVESIPSALREFYKVQTQEGIPVAHVTVARLGKTTEVLRGVRQEAGLYVTPYGKASPYFTRVSDALSAPSFSLVPDIATPKVITFKVGKVSRLPGKVLKSPGYESVNIFYKSQAGKGVAFIPKGSEAAFDVKIARTVKGGTSRELQAIVPETSKLQLVGGGTRLQRLFGFKKYTEYKGEFVPIQEYELITTGKPRVGKPVGTTEFAGIVKGSSSYLRGLKKPVTPLLYARPGVKQEYGVHYPYRDVKTYRALTPVRKAEYVLPRREIPSREIIPYKPYTPPTIGRPVLYTPPERPPYIPYLPGRPAYPPGYVPPKVPPIVPPGVPPPGFSFPFGREKKKAEERRVSLRKRYAPSLYGSTFAVKQARRGGTFTGFEIRGLTQKQARKVWAGF